MKALEIIAAIILIIGGLNWGLVGLFDFNLVDFIFGAGGFARLIYILVGLSALFQIYTLRELFGGSHAS